MFISAVSGYKIDTKLVSSLYTRNEKSEKEIKTIPLTIASKYIKVLEINLTKKAKDVYTKNYKTLLHKIKKHTNKCADIPYSSVTGLKIYC